ncbi:MAG TPA: DUF2993 domain-containing protein [Coleofasciculaceae cyanobacterium]|jgi:hypothetical protein
MHRHFWGKHLVAASALTCAAAAASLCWGGLPVRAEETPACPEMKTASGFSRAVQAMTGFTLLSGWVTNHFLGKELKDHIQGPLKARLSLFSGTDLLGGKAKRIRISGENLLLENLVPIHRLSFESQADSPLYVSKARHPFLLRPVAFKVSTVITEADLNRMLKSEQGRRKLTGMKVDIPPFGAHEVDMMDPRIDIDGDKIVIHALLNMHGAPSENALPVQVTGRLTAEKSRLNLSDLDIAIEGIEDTKPIARLVENYFGEIVNLERIKVSRHRVKVAIEKSQLANDQLQLEATLTVAPERKTLQRYLASPKK